MVFSSPSGISRSDVQLRNAFWKLSDVPFSPVKASGAMLSIPEQPENISVRVFVLVLASNRREGTVVRRVQFRKHWATVVALTFLAKSPAGIVSRAEHSENVLLKAVAPVSPSKIPAGTLFSAVAPAKRRSHLAEAVLFPKRRPTDSRAVQFSRALE